jgi:hypothetical protein
MQGNHPYYNYYMPMKPYYQGGMNNQTYQGHESNQYGYSDKNKKYIYPNSSEEKNDYYPYYYNKPS